MSDNLARLAWRMRLLQAEPLMGLQLAPSVAPLPAHLAPVQLGIPYPERLRAALPLWEKTLSPADKALEIIRHGLSLPLVTYTSAPYRPPVPSGSDVSLTEISAEIQRLLQLGAIRPLSDSEARRARFCNIFPRRKPNGAIRIIFDASPLNDVLPSPPRLALQDLRDARSLLENQTVAAVCDLTDAFFMVPLAPATQLLCSFRFGAQRYCYTVLPFGLSWSPFIAQAFTTRLLHAAALNCPAQTYVDDTLFAGTRRRRVHSALRRYVRVARALGFLVKEEKVQPPASTIVYLGAKFELGKETLSLTDRRHAALHRAAGHLLHLLRTSSPAPARRRAAQRLAGHLASVAVMSSAAFLPARPVLDFVRRRTRQSARAAASAAAAIAVSPNNAFPLSLAPSETLFTDASDNRWGAVLVKKHGKSSMISGTYPAWLSRKHIDAKELWAVGAAIRRFCIRDRCVRLLCDNRSALHAVRSGGRSCFLQQLAAQLHASVARRGVSLIPTWIPTADNPADAPSRGANARPSTSWPLSAPPLWTTPQELQKLAFLAPCWRPPALAPVARYSFERELWTSFARRNRLASAL
jgi:hypothetical protein